MNQPNKIRATDAPRPDVPSIRRDFPMLATEADGKLLVYLDNAAGTRKRLCVIDGLHAFYTSEYAKNDEGCCDSSSTTASRSR